MVERAEIASAEFPANAHAPENALVDKFGRRVNYLRLAVTDYCNLRCVYCMPAAGIPHVPQSELLSFREMERLLNLSVAMGVNRLRITGGEPFVRKGLIDFLWRASALPGLKEIHLTTNGALLDGRVHELKALGIAGVNLSLDTLHPRKFLRIARRDAFDATMAAFESLLQHEIALKINMVVHEGYNEDEIIPIAELARRHPIDVRFIEKMPFDGGATTAAGQWNFERILATLRTAYPGMEPGSAGPNATSRMYSVPGFRGGIGIIAGFSRLFCGTCNRLRITARGQLKTCLYDRGVLDLRSLLRGGVSDDALKAGLRDAVAKRRRDGFVVQREVQNLDKRSQSMSAIGG